MLVQVLTSSAESRTSAIGTSRTKEIIFTTRLIEAEEVLNIGLVSEVLEGRGAVMTRTCEHVDLTSPTQCPSKADFYR